jgi:hypothetical protein
MKASLGARARRPRVSHWGTPRQQGPAKIGTVGENLTTRRAARAGAHSDSIVGRNLSLRSFP